MTAQMEMRLTKLKTFVANTASQANPRAREILIKREVDRILKHLYEEDAAGRQEVLDQLRAWGLLPR